MVRMLVFLIFIAAVALGITWLSMINGSVSMRVGDTIIDARIGALIGLFAFAGLLVMLCTSGFKDLIALPGKLKRKRADALRERGMVSLARGLEAVAAGDAEDALRLARVATKQLEEPRLTRLLSASAAQLAGDDDLAEQSYAAMLEAPETEFLGLRGLYEQALHSGDKKAAMQYAERAFQLRPNAAWAFNSVYQLSIDRGAWGNAREALQLAGKNNVVHGEEARRREAALLTAGAYAARASEDTVSALKDAEAAVKLAPEFTPAATLAAELRAATGSTGKAAKHIEAAWEANPHPALSATYEQLLADMVPEKRAAKIMKMAAKSADNDDSQFLMAEQHLVLEEWDAAIEKLEPLLSRNPKARTFAAMAKATAGKYDDSAAQIWLTKAATAPRDPMPGSDGVFHFTTDGWRRLVQEFGEHGRLAPPPLEEVSAALSRDEVKLLLMPPPEPEVEEAADEQPVPEQDVEPPAEAETTATPKNDDLISPDPAEPVEEVVEPPRPDA